MTYRTYREVCLLTIDADKKIKKLARRIIEDAGLPYTEAQLK